MPHTQTQCDHCGQVDDHPKLHTPGATYHHDCIPHNLASMPGIADHPTLPLIIEAAKSGKRGDALRHHIIHELHPDQIHAEG